MKFIIQEVTRAAELDNAKIEYKAHCPETKRDYKITFPYGLENADIDTYSGTLPVLQNVWFKATEETPDLSEEHGAAFMVLKTGDDIRLIYDPDALVLKFCVDEKRKIERINKQRGAEGNERNQTAD